MNRLLATAVALLLSAACADKPSESQPAGSTPASRKVAMTTTPKIEASSMV